MNRVVTHVAWLIAVSMAWPVDAAPMRIEVQSDRVRLGDIVHGDGSAADLDLGPAPKPGNSRVITREDIRRRLRRALLPSTGLRIPSKVRVFRRGQKLSELRLTEIARTKLLARLPQGTQITRVAVSGGVIMPRGDLSARIDSRSSLRSGRNLFRMVLRAAGKSPRTVMITADLEHAQVRPKILVRRGDRIMVNVIAPGVHVRTRGVAQQDGALGDVIVVLPMVGQKVVHGRISGTDAVEVEL